MTRYITYVWGSQYSAATVNELVDLLRRVFEDEGIHPIGSSNEIKMPGGSMTYNRIEI